MANVAIDLVAFRGITITPTFKYEDNYYGPQSAQPGRRR
jgi:hypothetical protein